MAKPPRALGRFPRKRDHGHRAGTPETGPPPRSDPERTRRLASSRQDPVGGRAPAHPPPCRAAVRGPPRSPGSLTRPRVRKGPRRRRTRLGASAPSAARPTGPPRARPHLGAEGGTGPHPPPTPTPAPAPRPRTRRRLRGRARPARTARRRRCPGCGPRGRRTGTGPFSQRRPMGRPPCPAGERPSPGLGRREGDDGRGPTRIRRFGRRVPRLRGTSLPGRVPFPRRAARARVRGGRRRREAAVALRPCRTARTRSPRRRWSRGSSGGACRRRCGPRPRP